MENKLPDEFVSAGLPAAKDCTLFDVRWEDMTRDDLIAAAVQGWKAEAAERAEAHRYRCKQFDWALRR